MFHFAAKQAIILKTEMGPMREVNTVLFRWRQNRVRHRAVLSNA